MVKLLFVLALAAGAAFALWPRDGGEPAPRGADGAGAAAAERRAEARREADRRAQRAAARERRRRTSLPRPACRDGVPGCRSASGRIVYVERVDADGDGDLHVIVSDRQGISLPGLTAFDVSKDLRPRRDPRAGDRASAMGPVQTGSYGQSQIHALEFHTRRG